MEASKWLEREIKKHDANPNYVPDKGNWVYECKKRFYNECIAQCNGKICEGACNEVDFEGRCFDHYDRIFGFGGYTKKFLVNRWI